MKNKKIVAFMIGTFTMCLMANVICAAAQMDAESCKDATMGYSEPIAIKVGLKDDASLTFEGNETRTENSWMDLYENLGIHLDVMFTASDEQMADKLSQTMISGDYPDIFFVDIADYKDYVDQGLIADVSDYYEEYVSEETLNYLMSDGGNALETAKLDGRLYGLPQLTSSYDGVPILWIRKDWLDNLGLQVPTTTDEFVSVAKAFTTDDPDGNGEADTYGFGLNGAEQTGNYSGIPYFFTMYGAIPSENTFIEEDGMIIWGGMKEENMKAGLSDLLELYERGCIPTDFISDDRAAVEADFTSGKTGMIIAPMWAVLGTYGNALALDIDTEIIAVPLPVSEVNSEGAVYLPSATLGYWCVSSKCDNPEALFKMFNLSTHYIANVQNRTVEEQEMYCTGKSGVYTGKALALIPYLDDPTNNYNSWKNISVAIASGEADNLVADQLTNYQNIAMFLENKNIESYAMLSEDELSKFNSGAGFYTVFGTQESGYGALDIMIRAGKWYPEAYVGAPTESMVLNSANLMSYTSETIVNIIMGNNSVDSYSDFISSWLERGGQAILNEIQAQ